METTAGQSCDIVENGQDDSHKQFALPTKKRPIPSTNLFSIEGSSQPKYRKLTEERVITKMTEVKTNYAILATADISSDEFSNMEDNINREKDASDSGQNESPEANNCDCASNCNSNTSEEEKYQKCLETASESDGGSIDISPQKDLPVFERMENIIEQKHKIMRKFAFISSAAKLHNSIIHTPQFSCNDEENNTEINTLPNPCKQSNSSIDIPSCMHEEIQEISSAHEEIIPGSSSNTCTDFRVQYVNEENSEKDLLLANQHFTMIEKTSDKDSSNIIKSNDSIVVESEMQHGIELQNNINNIDSTLDHNYIECINNKSSEYYSSENLHQSSNVTDSAVVHINSETSRSSSVSDFTLAQLVLSLKEDVQKLTEKIERQEHILDVVAHVNEISIAPLFAISFPEKYNLKVPFNTIEEFDKFNQDLARDTLFCNEFITSLCSYIDNNVTFAKNIMNMLKKYMSKDLVTLYTASKATTNKMVLKDTIFCKCLLQATRMTIRNGLLPLEHEKAFIKALGTVVSGAKGWHTHEEDRK